MYAVSFGSSLVQKLLAAKASKDLQEFGIAGCSACTGFTALMYAAELGDLASTQLLVESGAAVNTKAGNEGSSALLTPEHQEYTALSITSTDEVRAYLLSQGAVELEYHSLASKDLKQNFDFFDLNSDNQIERDEVYISMFEIGKNMSDLEVDEAFALWDLDLDGLISRQEA